jgi:hypothetical protein
MRHAVLTRKEHTAKAAFEPVFTGLRIGAPDHALEREADRVAEEVMAGKSVMRGWSLTGMSLEPVLQPKCACGGSAGVQGECEECREKKKGTLQRKAVGSESPATVPPIVHEVLRSPGQQLGSEPRAFFERRFGYTFGQVQVHDGEHAARSAESLQAAAYTVGSHIVFGRGEYKPASGEGRRLIAHELAHVLQQSGGCYSLQRTPAVAKPIYTLGQIVRVSVAGKAHPDWQWLTLLDKPNGNKVATIENHTLLRVGKQVPGTENLDHSPGVFWFTVMQDCFTTKTDGNGKEISGVADSDWVEGYNCPEQQKNKPAEAQKTEEPQQPELKSAEQTKSPRRVYACSRLVDNKTARRLGISHTFFRVGLSYPYIKDTEILNSYSLFPHEKPKGSSCWYGEFQKDSDPDLTSTEAVCKEVPVSEDCLERESASYPLGYYCTGGPNSNTFTRHILLKCGNEIPDWPKWHNPWGFWEAEPPPEGTAATKHPDNTIWDCPIKKGC